ncbi:autotransporter domain-containing protein [Eoetvoesiella caeni]
MRLLHLRLQLSIPTIACATAMAFVAIYPPASLAQTWTAVGPSPATSPNSQTNVVIAPDHPAAGAMRMVLPSPDNPDIMFAGGVNAGIWQTLNGGKSWQPIGDDLASLSIGAMAFDKSDPTKLWVGFGKQSSYHSISGAQTGIVLFDTTTGKWEPPPSGYTGDLMGKDISQIIANGNNIVVGIKTSPNESGFWSSRDGGTSFQQSTALQAGNVTSLVQDPTKADHYYAAVINPEAGKPKGVYRTDDGGQSWQHLGNLPISNTAGAGLPITYDIMLSIAKDGTLIASVIDPIQTAKDPIRENPRVIVYRSTDQGDSWTSMGSPTTLETLPNGTTKEWGIYSGGQFNLHGALLVDPNDSNVVYISGDTQGPDELVGEGKPTSIGAKTYSGRLFRGTLNANGQTIWEVITDNYTADGSGPHADSRFMMIDAAGNLLQTDDGGIYLRTDPKSRNGVWQSLNSNLQSGEVHAATWNPLTHTVVTAMQDNGATMQLKAGSPVHLTLSGGDGGIAAVNPTVQINNQRYAALYTSAQYLSDLTRTRVDGAGKGIKQTSLELGVEKNGVFFKFDDSKGAIKPARPKTPVYSDEALAAQTVDNVEAISFYPAFRLNNIDPTRFVVGGYHLYIGQDALQELPGNDQNKGGENQASIRIVTEKIFDAPRNPGFTALAYGARNNADALLAGTGFQAGLSTPGSLYYTPDVHGQTPPVDLDLAAISGVGGTGIMAALFDKDLGTDEIYVSNGLNILRGTATSNTSSPYAIENINRNLPPEFNERRGLDHIFKHGVSALVTAGTHNVAGGNWLYTLRGPASTPIDSLEWDKRLGRIPNAPVFGLDYSVEDDVLLAYTMGRGAFALYDVTTHFAEATQLVFGQAGNNSQAVNSQLIDGETLTNVAFSRPLIKLGAGTLDLSGTTASYSGGTQLYGGVTQVNANANLGAAGTSVSFDNAALRFTEAFSMDRPIVLHQGGGTIDTNNLAIQQASQPISGEGQLTITGGGQYTLTADNSHSGGTFIDHASLTSSSDAQLGAAQGGVRFDAGQLNLLDGFTLDETQTLHRRLIVDAGNGTLNTNNNDIPFAGSIDGTGILSFMGRPLQIAGDLSLNATWNGAMTTPAGKTLRGTGHVNGALTVHGRLYPGNSPGTLTATGPVVQMPGSTFATDIDGTATNTGAGSYSRLLVLGPNQTYTAGGEITPILRGISGSASNTYSPPLGQGFTVVEASGKVLGSYSSLIQPASGLIAGSRFDAIYRDQAIQLYVTPASYASLGTLGLNANSNQQSTGAALDQSRPAAGLRAADDRKPLFDALAPLQVQQLQPALDQLGGTVYAPLLWADLDNSKFLASQLMDEMANIRRTDYNHGIQARPTRAVGQSGAWAYALRRNSRLDNDKQGYGYSDSTTGVLLGVDRPLGSHSAAGIALGYLNGKADVDGGSGRLQSWQLMGYASHSNNGWFADGTAGFGIGQIAARRSLTLPGLSDVYRSDLRSRNLALAGRTGFSLGQTAGPRLEAWLGLQYLASRHLSATEGSGQSSARLDLKAGSLQSLSPSIGVLGSVPFQAGGADWRASLKTSVSHELLDNRATVNAVLLGAPININGASVGRTALNVGLGLTGQINRRFSVQADISRDSASGWQATTGSLSLRYQW